MAKAAAAAAASAAAWFVAADAFAILASVNVMLSAHVMSKASHYAIISFIYEKTSFYGHSILGDP